jgi:hypothetical protein
LTTKRHSVKYECIGWYFFFSFYIDQYIRVKTGLIFLYKQIIKAHGQVFPAVSMKSITGKSQTNTVTCILICHNIIPNNGKCALTKAWWYWNKKIILSLLSGNESFIQRISV